MADQIEPVVEGEVHELLDKARERWKHPTPIPSCYLDGVHSSGSDRRYTGILQDMYAVCCCFLRYGNIEPENRWLPEFYPTDGLEILCNQLHSCNQLQKKVVDEGSGKWD